MATDTKGNITMKNNVAIITWHYYHNFGSALQAYALQASIKKLEKNVKILNYRDLIFGKYSQSKLKLQSVLHLLFSKKTERLSYAFPFFQEKYFYQTTLVTDRQKLGDIGRKFDTVVCGSDQIWAPNALNTVYLLDFLPERTEKVSYAASIGLNEIPIDKQQVYRDALKSFKAVSIREQKGAELLKDVCDIDAQVVLDPTLLLNKEEWTQLEQPVQKLIDSRFLFCYLLKADHNYKNRILEYAKEKNQEVLGFSANESDNSWMRILKNIGPCEFLWLIHHADTVITDSYHGTIFSLLYHKRFITIERFNSDDGICQNSRIDQLRSNFGLEKEIVPQNLPEKLSVSETDYSLFEERLGKLRVSSIGFLKDALR